MIQEHEVANVQKQIYVTEFNTIKRIAIGDLLYFTR